MVTIEDVGPRADSTLHSGQFATGRMLCVDSSDDAQLVFAGSFSSGLWVSEDGGQSWAQDEKAQPAAGVFGVAGAMGGFCVPSVAVGPDSARWSGERNPRFLADLTGDGRADIVGFGDTGVWTSLSNGDGTFAPPRVVLADFGAEAGGWHPDRHPRFLADLTGDGRADIVGFGDAGVYVALGNGDGTFQPVRFVLADFGVEQGWRVERHPRHLADLTGDGRADIVGFGDAGVYVALNDGDGTFAFTPVPAIADFGVQQGWRVERHPRLLADLTGDGRADIVGFGDAGVYVAVSHRDGTFRPVRFVLADLGYDHGWRVERHPRLLADVTGEGRADIVGFGDAGIYVARGHRDGSFAFTPVPAVDDLGYDQGWRVERHPRFLADVTGDGRADVVGFGDAGVYVSLSRPATTGDPTSAPLGSARFVLANFGFEATVLAIARCDRELRDAGVWRSSDRGATWTLVHSFPRGYPPADALPGAGQLVWAPGSATHVYAAGGTSLAVSTDGGATFADAILRPGGGSQAVNHVAVGATPAGSLLPPVVYALAASQILVSFDAGATWIEDGGQIPGRIGGGVGLSNSQSDRVMVVSPRSPLEVFVTGDANQVPPALWRGDYLQFLGTHESSWEPMPLPTMGQQFSGNVFVGATLQGHGDVLFYGPQRSQVFAAPLDPTSASDWHALDSSGTHVDLHGIFLSPDFEATFHDGQYESSAGTVWLTSDGGIFRSTDGGRGFHVAGSISSLSVVNLAGAALEGQGPVLVFGTGDNDGFTSHDGGGSWGPQDYGGGDDDCAWADPLRPGTMLVFTPRWDQHGTFVGSGLGQTMAVYDGPPGGLPDPGSAGGRTMVAGPPLRPGSFLWNASSGYSIRGSRPIVRNLPADPPDTPDDYLAIRFFGNYSSPDGSVRFPNNLAVLLRARQIRDMESRTDWDTPGGWRVEKHPRLLADLTGDGKADIVGFGDAGVWTALSTSGGSFATPHLVLADFGAEAGGWRVDRHPRLLADLTGDGKADILGFGDAGVYVALGNGDGTFQPVRFVVADFGPEAGGWQTDRHPRFLTDLTGDGRADIVGFGDAGVYVALGNGDGTFQEVRFVVPDFGVDQGWRVDRHPRFLADLTGDGRADIVGFGDAGVYVALGNGDGTFQQVRFVVADFGPEAGGWQTDRHPRFLADLTGDGRADIVGFGDAGVYVALSNGDGTFAFTPVPALADFGVQQEWQTDRHPRFLADVTGDGRAEVVGFGDAGVLVGVNNGNGTFVQRALFVIPNLGYRDSGPVEQVGPFLPDPDVGVVQASGGHVRTEFFVGGDRLRRLWKWTEGMAEWQQLVPGGGASHASRFFVDPYRPDLVYLLDDDHVRRSDDGGATWQVDEDLERQLSCDGRIPVSRNEDADGQGDHYDIVLSDMQFDPFDPLRRFAVGLGGAFMTTDGASWTRLLDTGALRGRPANCYYDSVSHPSDPALYVAFAGRSIVKITGLATPEAASSTTVRRAAPAPAPAPAPAGARDGSRPRVRTGDGRVGTTEAMPDERVLITLDDGSSFVVEGDQLTPQDDGGYLV